MCQSRSKLTVTQLKKIKGITPPIAVDAPKNPSVEPSGWPKRSCHVLEIVRHYTTYKAWVMISLLQDLHAIGHRLHKMLAPMLKNGKQKAYTIDTKCHTRKKRRGKEEIEKNSILPLIEGRIRLDVNGRLNAIGGVCSSRCHGK